MRQRRDPACFRQSTDNGNIWLQEVRGTLLNDVPECEARRLALAGRNWHWHSPPNFRQHGEVVVGQHRLLEPGQLILIPGQLNVANVNGKVYYVDGQSGRVFDFSKMAANIATGFNEGVRVMPTGDLKFWVPSGWFQ
jgi:hypothetical protein